MVGGDHCVVVLRLLIAVTFLAVEHRPVAKRASVAVVHGLSCSVACGIFLDRGSNPCPLAGRFFTAGPPEKSFKKKIIYFWLHQVLVEGHRLSFPEACGILVP